MKSEIKIGTKIVAIKELMVHMGHLDQSDVEWNGHQRGRNWVATVKFDPAAPNGLNREFWKRGSGSFAAVPVALEVGAVVEFAGDYFTCGGNRRQHRAYRRVLAVTPQTIVVRETVKPGKSPLRPVKDDIQAAELDFTGTPPRL